MARIILYTGGQRSGKSALAEAETLRLAGAAGSRPVYLATARVWPGDEDFAARVAAHQARRGPEWINVEEPLYPSRHIYPGCVMLLDCVTLWATNAMFLDPDRPDAPRALELMTAELRRIAAADMTLVAVTNEVGLGGVSPDALARRFADLQGDINRAIAREAERVVLTVSGIPVTIKNQE